MTETLPQLATDLDAILHHAALLPLDDIGWLRVTGDDRVRWLNGMVTNSINDLASGRGNYNFFLNAQGRIRAEAYAFALEDFLLLETASPGNVATFLDGFIIMDDVELEVIGNRRADRDASHESHPLLTDRFGILLAGPDSVKLLSTLGLAVPGELSLSTLEWQGRPIDLIAARNPLIARYELWAGESTMEALQQALTAAGASTASPEALEALRLLEGTPRYGTDIRDRDLPQETAQTHALHFSKGCYLGQEIVERIRSRGQVHRTLHGFRLEGAFPPSNTPIDSNGKPVGELTSIAAIPLGSGTIQLALGMIRREALTTPLTYTGGTAHPIPLPYTRI